MSKCTYQVNVGWSGGKNTGVFTLGSSVLDTGFFGFEFIPGFPGYGGPYDDATAECTEFQITRGKDDNLTTMLASEATATLYDPTGKFNPKNTASPIYGQVRPLRPARLAASYLGVTYELFNGFLRLGDDNPDYGHKEAKLNFVDMFVWLDRAAPVFTLGATTTGGAINAILDAIFWPVNRRTISVGSSIPGVVADGSKSGLQLISDLLEADRGVFFSSAAGIPTYLDRWAIDKLTSTYTFTAADEQIPGEDLEKIKNRAIVTRTGGVAQTYFDQASVDEFGFADVGAITTPYLNSDSDAQQLARYLVMKSKDPVSAIWSFGVVEDPATPAILQNLLGVDLQKRISVQTPGITQDYITDKIVHQAKAGSLHQVTYTLSEVVPVHSFVLDSSTFDSTDILTF